MIKVISTNLLRLTLFSSAIALALGINYISAATTWVGPTALPPGNNTYPPLNIGTTNQVKDANLSVGHSANTTSNTGFTVYGSQSTNGTVYGGGNAGGVIGNGVVGYAGGNGATGVVGIGPNNNTGYGVFASGGNGSAYYGALGRADGYSFVGNGELYNNGIIRSVSGGVAFPDGTVQTSAGSIPSGAVMAFYLSSCPSGWRAADGTVSTPDLRGQFVRGLSNGSAVDAGRVLGTQQGDAIRNITGEIGPIDSVNYNGVFSTSYQMGWGATMNSHGDPVVKFDASKVVPTANEDRPVNVALLYCMKN